MSHLEIVDLKDAQEALAAIGVTLSERQLRRAAEPNNEGKRKLPFFVDPVDGLLKINKSSLLRPYIERVAYAKNNMQ